MRPPSRIRRIAKWSGLVLCLLIGLPCTVSQIRPFGLPSLWHSPPGLPGGKSTFVANGVLITIWQQGSPNLYLGPLGPGSGNSLQPAEVWHAANRTRLLPEVWMSTRTPMQHWTTRWPSGKTPSHSAPPPAAVAGPLMGWVWTVIVPLWLVLFPCVAMTAWLWRRDRRTPGHCRACGYNLFGNVSGICPECGLRIEPPQTQTRAN